MVSINLLPWRELQHHQEQKQFKLKVLIGIMSILSLIISFNYYLDHLINHQTHRNDILQREINRIEKNIQVINNLKLQRKEFISKITMIKKVKERNVLIIHLLDELLNAIPPKLYLNQLEVKKDLIFLQGIAPSNEEITLLIKNIENSLWLQKPILMEIKNMDEQKQSMASEFKLGVTFKTQNQMG